MLKAFEFRFVFSVGLHEVAVTDKQFADGCLRYAEEVGDVLLVYLLLGFQRGRNHAAGIDKVPGAFA